MSWKDIAKDLPLDGHVRIECTENCGSGDTLSVNHSVKKYWCNCYRCGYTDVEFKGQQTLGELKRIQELNDIAASIELELELPHDFTTEIPRHGRAWLFQAGITEQDYRGYGVGYSESLDRVVLPIYDVDGNLEWYQCRALQHGQKPKYLQPSRDRSKVMLRIRGSGKSLQRVIVVEDILSAYRVGKHITTFSLLGTKISTAQASELGEFDLVTTWLDPDKAGRQGAYKIRKTLSLITEVSNIVTDRDPKELSDKEIKQCLNKH